MTSVALSPKYQIVIPKAVREVLKLVPGQSMEVRAVAGKIEVVPVLPMSAACGMFPGLDSHVPNDPEFL